MNGKIKYALYFFIMIGITVSIAIISYKISNGTLYSVKTSAVEADDYTNTNIATNNQINENEANKGGSEENGESTVEKYTTFIFEDVYSDEKKEIEKIVAPKEFVGLNESALQENYKDWNMLSFGAEEVYFSREVEIPKDMYVLTSLDNELVVYFKDSVGNVTLEQKTGIMLSDLPEADITKISQGLVYYNKGDIVKALQNYDN